MANTYDFNLTIGSSANFRLTATDQNGTALNLSGFQVRGQVRKSYSSDSILFNLPVSIYSPVSGLVDINITGSSITGIKPSVYPYDLECFLTGDNGLETYTSKFLKGYAFCGPEVTR